MTDDRDLSRHHAPLGALFRDAAESSTFRLTKEQRQSFSENGFLSGLPCLTNLQVEALRDELRIFLNSDQHEVAHLWHEYHSNESPDPNQVLFHALGAWRIGSAFHDLLWHPAVTVPAMQLLEGGVRFWHDQLFCKPAKHGGVVAWHQDYSYWTRTQPMAHLTCWIALDDSTAENGCLQYVPGSHRWPLLPMPKLAGDLNEIERLLDPEQQRRFHNPTAIELKAGECSFHHPLLMHGSFANTTAGPRRAAVINMVRDGVHSATDQSLLQGIPALPVGQPLGGQFFPLLRRHDGPDES